MCHHNYGCIGYVEAFRWLGGVAGQIMIPVQIKVEQCDNCGKIE